MDYRSCPSLAIDIAWRRVNGWSDAEIATEIGCVPANVEDIVNEHADTYLVAFNRFQDKLIDIKLAEAKIAVRKGEFKFVREDGRIDSSLFPVELAWVECMGYTETEVHKHFSTDRESIYKVMEDWGTYQQYRDAKDKFKKALIDLRVLAYKETLKNETNN